MPNRQATHGVQLSEINTATIKDYLIQLRSTNLDYHEANSFLLNPSTKELPILYHSPFLLPDMEEAVLHFLSYVSSGKKVLLYGDRDSDGVCSTTLLSHFIRSEFPSANFLSITSSENDAYGLCKEAMDRIKKFEPNLVITLDFGTSNYSEICELHSLGISTIVLDHHETPSKNPPGYLINPKKEGSKYPNKKICTAFLALKFIVAVQFIRSEEFNKLYLLIEDNLQESYYKNGLPYYPTEAQELPLAYHITNQDLPGDKSLATSDRLFYMQIARIPNLLRIQYESAGLAGIGTITDMMPLVGENRVLVKLCCHYLAYNLTGKINGFPGLNRILFNLNLRTEKITSKDIGWSIGPLLNAAGRMGRTELAFELLMTQDEILAESKTKELLKVNENRKERTKRNIHRVNLYFQRHPEKTQHPIVICYEPEMEPGVSGIVATRMVETFSKPAIFITPDHGKARGSIRSYGNENVLDILNSAEDLLDHFGGHPEAGGFSVAIEKIPKLIERLITKSIDWNINSTQEKKSIESDFQVLPKDINKELFQNLEILEPTGQGNPAIILSLQNVEPVYFNFMGDGSHARFRVMGAGSLKFVIWNDAKSLSLKLSLQSKVSLWGQLEENNFQGKINLQFVVIHFE